VDKHGRCWDGDPGENEYAASIAPAPAPPVGGPLRLLMSLRLTPVEMMPEGSTPAPAPAPLLLLLLLPLLLLPPAAETAGPP
jgi:hypothetical protein